MFRDVFELYIVFTRNCNLRCTYCYESKTNNSISYEVLDKTIEFIKEHKKINIINLFGGEAFLELDKIEYFTDKLIDLKKIQNRNFLLYTNTNGTICNEKFLKVLKKLSDNFKFHYVISIDGNKKFHDSKRKTVDNKPTYDLIFKNIKFIQNNSKNTIIDFHTVIQTEMCDNFYDVAKEIIRNPNFKMGAFEYLMKVDGKIHYTVKDFENIFKALMKLNQEGYSVKFLLERFNNIIKSIDYKYNNFYKSKEYCSNGRTALAIDYDGLVYPCDYYLTLKDYKQKQYAIYDMFKGIIKNNINRLKTLTKENEEQQKECNNCEIKHSCYICLAVKEILGNKGLQLECEQNKMILKAMNNVKFKIS